jgi:DNA-binding SARP family transcriptional activator
MSDYGRARELVEDTLKIALKSHLHIFDFLILALGISVSLNSSDYITARQYLKKMSLVLKTNSHFDIAQYHYLKGWKAWLRDDFFKSIEHLEKSIAIMTKSGDWFYKATVHIRLAQIYCEYGKLRQATFHLAQTRRFNHQANSHLIKYNWLLTKSLFAFKYGKESLGLKYLKKALSLGKEKGFLFNAFWDSSVMARLCVKALNDGIEVAHVQKVIHVLKLVPEHPSLDCEHWPWPIKIFTLGRFSLVKEGSSVQFSVRAQKKPLEMLKALISYGGRGVSEERLSDVFWPEADGDMAHQAFATTLHRLRKLLGEERAFLFRDGKLTLEPQYCWVDTWAFECILGQAEAASREGNRERAIQLSERALSKYHGPFLPEDDGALWSFPHRERLRNKFIRCTVMLGRYLEESGEFDKAIDCYRKGLEIDYQTEEFYWQLMQCLIRLDRRAEALAIYRRCRRVMAVNLESLPFSKKIETFHINLPSELN